MVKCCYCKQQDDIENMIIIYSGKTKKYCHEKCKTFNEREKEELNNLVETIKNILNIKTIPPRFYPFLQDLRNGTDKCNRMTVSKSKKGYRYLIIEKTYDTYKKVIIQGIRLKKIEDDMKKLLYAYAIISPKCGIIRNKLYREYLDKKKEENNNKDNNITRYNNDIKLDNSKKQKKYSWLEEN